MPSASPLPSCGLPLPWPCAGGIQWVNEIVCPFLESKTSFAWSGCLFSKGELIETTSLQIRDRPRHTTRTEFLSPKAPKENLTWMLVLQKKHAKGWRGLTTLSRIPVQSGGHNTHSFLLRPTFPKTSAFKNFGHQIPDCKNHQTAKLRKSFFCPFLLHTTSKMH